MKTSFTSVIKVLVLAFFITLTLLSCQKNDRYNQGPRGFDGEAFFGVSYSSYMPYSYADNNPSIPFNPILGEYYHAYPGHYEFEYFVNPYEYWYGTYDLWINAGGVGGDSGEPGLDGFDNYLMLICDPYGYYEERTFGKNATNLEEITIEQDEVPVKITMKLTNVSEREPRLQVKFSNEKSLISNTYDQ